MGVTRVLFQEIARVPIPEGDPPPKPSNPKIELGVRITMLADRRAEVMITVVVTPDPRVKPYDIQVDLGGVFTVRGEGTQEELTDFCQKAAPTILFPYIRQTIASVTSDGRYGRVLLPLLNLQNLIDSDKWVREGILPDGTTPATPDASS
jgi:preprotein translocase subunit SecB